MREQSFVRFNELHPSANHISPCVHENETQEFNAWV